jgi:hypothetical protein
MVSIYRCIGIFLRVDVLIHIEINLKGRRLQDMIRLNKINFLGKLSFLSPSLLGPFFITSHLHPYLRCVFRRLFIFFIAIKQLLYWIL